MSQAAVAISWSRRQLAWRVPEQDRLRNRIVRAVDALRRKEPGSGPVAPGAPAAAASILDSYVKAAPSPQTAVDIFAGEWAARFPPPLDDLRAGLAPLFEVEHVAWGVEVLGGVTGGRVVELGPLEGGHSYVLDRLGAREVVAIEANTRAFLKCLIAKELLGIPSARFLCGDFVAYLADHAERQAPRFDLCLASGVLYHLADPVPAIALMRKASDRLILWTHYYDPELVRGRPDLAVRFPSSQAVERAGFLHTLYRQEYQGALGHPGFAGGTAEASNWMNREDIIGALEHVGYEVVAIGHEEPDHKGQGPCFCIAARALESHPA